MKNPMQPIDLHESVRLGIAHIRNSVDRERDCRPYFRFNLISPPIWSQHEAGDTPHTVGRFLHALNVCAQITGLPDDTELLNGLRKQMFASCNHNDGFAWDDIGYDPAPPMAFMHHQREALLGLIAIREILEDPQAERYARALVTAMEASTRGSGTYPGARLGPEGWQQENLATTTSGRAISALLAYSRTFDDSRGVDLALRFARHVLAVSFGEGGELTPAAGTHIHSITGTVASLVELGLVTNQQEFIDRARRVFDVGMLPYRTQTGWVKESVRATYGRGEANCTADLIEAACLLGTAGYTAYFEDAERMLRNHLLASQMDDLSWVVENEGMANTEKHAYEGLRRRAHGAFCFGEPNGFHSYNSDLTGAALQGIAAAWEHTVTSESDGSVRVNLLLSGEHDAVRITSSLPQVGKVVVEPKRAMELAIRVPPWCERKSLAVAIDGTDVPTKISDDYFRLSQLREGTHVEITVTQPQFLTQERALGHEMPYRVRWLGNTVIAMSGAGKHTALYPELDAAE
ncbi:MAG: glycoside hydrolase family 127 protein [Candidatus Poribacteria bacterium]|nr:glycoside hydrolase family 127 protein [Candidatus Poribacteria bacterium]